MRNGMRRWLVAALLAGVASPAAAEDGATVATRFGQLEAVRQMSLSPGGTQVAYIAGGPSGSQILYVVDIAGGGVPKGIMKQAQPEITLRSCTWVTDVLLTCEIDRHMKHSGIVRSISRVISVSSDGKQVSMLSVDYNPNALYGASYGGKVVDWSAGAAGGHVLMTREYVPESHEGGSNINTNAEGLGVDEVDVATRIRHNVEKPRLDAIEFISDGKGKIRVMGRANVDPDGVLRGITHYFYRKANSRDWLELSDVKVVTDGLETGFDPWAVDPVKDVVYGFDYNEGRKALFTRALDGSLRQDLVLARNDVDVDGLIRIGRQRRVVGASYATDRREAEYFDPELRKLGAGLEKALPGHPAIDFVDASADESKLLIYAGTDVQPGTYFLYDKVSHGLGQLLPVRPSLEGVALAPMRTVEFPAADGTMIPAYLTVPTGSSGKGLPAIVMPHGGPNARDEWGFDWLVQFFAARGFAVIQPQFRGSGGYGAAWYQKNGFKSWRTAVGDVNDAARWLVGQGIADKGKLAIFGWSYGGYAALQSQVLDPDLFKAVVAVAPVTDLQLLRNEEFQTVSSTLSERFIGSGPHIQEGSPAQNVARFRVPVLMFHGDHDQNVDIEQSRYMVGKLKGAGKQVEYIEYPGLTHSLVSSDARIDMLKRSDAFFRQMLGLTP